MNRGLSFSHRRMVLFSLLLIAVVCFLSYSNTFHVPFQFDDSPNISEKPFVRDISMFFDPARFSPDSVFIMRPVTYFTFALNYWIHGTDVVGYHVFNLLIHILNGFLVYFFVLLTFRTPYFTVTGPFPRVGDPSEERLRTCLPDRQASRMDKQDFISLFAALLFASHPVQTQAVTYIVQRTASMATMFFLLSLVMYIKWRLITQESGVGKKVPKSVWPSAVWYLSSLFSAVLAMKTKEMAFTLPLVTALYEFLFFTGPVKKRLLFLVPFLLTMLIIPINLISIGKPTGEIIGDVSEATKVETDIPRWNYLFTEFRVIITYIRLLFLPVNQNLDYDYPIFHSFFDPNVFLSFLFLSALFGTGVYLLYRSRITPPYLQSPGKATPMSSALAEELRRSASPLDAGGGTVRNDPGRGKKGISVKGEKDSLQREEEVPAVYFRLIAFGIFWFLVTLSVESSVIPIADVIFEHRLYLPSIGFFISAATGVSMVLKRAANISKKWAKLAIGVLGLIIVILSGATYARNALWTDEVKLWEDVVKKSPLKVRPHSNLGHFYGMRGRFEEAIREYRIALSLDPYDFQVHNNLGVIYKAQGRIAEAEREYRTAVRLQPDDAMAYYNLGNIFREQGKFEEAVQQYQTAIRLSPEVAVLHNNLGLTYEGLGNTKGAEQEYRAALHLEPDYETARRNLEELLRGGG